MQADATEPPAFTLADYEAIIKGVNVLGMALSAVNAVVVNRQAIMQQMPNVQPRVDFAAMYENVRPEGSEAGFAIVQQQVSVAVGEGDEVWYALQFSIQIDFQTEKEFSDGFFDAFKNSTLLTIAMPMAREFIISTMSRMNVPPLTLPIFFAPPPSFGDDVEPMEEL